MKDAGSRCQSLIQWIFTLLVLTGKSPSKNCVSITTLPLSTWSDTHQNCNYCHTANDGCSIEFIAIYISTVANPMFPIIQTGSFFLKRIVNKNTSLDGQNSFGASSLTLRTFNKSQKNWSLEERLWNTAIHLGRHHLALRGSFYQTLPCVGWVGDDKAEKLRSNQLCNRKTINYSPKIKIPLLQTATLSI